MGRRGPKPSFVEDHHRNEIVGLVLRSDGRYTAHDDRNKTFGRDKVEAIRRFLEWKNKREEKTIVIPVEETCTGITQITKQVNGNKFVVHTPPHEFKHVVNTELPEAAFWAKWKDILSTPKGRMIAAQNTGYRQLEYLTELAPPQPSATLKTIIERYSQDKKGLMDDKGIKNSETWWKEFAQITGAKTVSDLTLESFRTYRQEIRNRKGDRSDAWIRSRFGQVNTVMNHALKEMNISAQDREILQFKSLLVKPPQPMGNPKCLEVDELKAILKHADDFDKALILFALNCAYYPIDCKRITWDKIDFNTKSITRFPRIKSQKKKSRPIPRSAVLWDRTIEALKKLKRTELPNVFISEQGTPIAPQTIQRHFERCRDAAGIKREITFGNLRDTAQTIAAQYGAPIQQYKCLAGHACGIDDNYIVRNPFFTKDACKATENHFFGNIGDADLNRSE